MKRVLYFGGNKCVSDLNEWLRKHPGVDLVDVRAVENTVLGGMELFCVVNIPDSVDTSGWPDDMLEYLGMKDD